MRFEELMIGDFLQIKAFYRNDKNEEEECYLPVKIAQIGNSIIVEHIRPIIENEKYQVLSSFESIQPIPLTPEILEKNGFEPIYDDKSGFGYKKIGDGDDEYDSVLIDFTHPRLSRVYSQKERKEYNGSIVYVHQLQHALKLANIEKEIEL